MLGDGKESVSLSVERSVLDENGSFIATSGAILFNILRRGVIYALGGAPSVSVSAQGYEPTRKYLIGSKLRNIVEIYSSYVGKK